MITRRQALRGISLGTALPLAGFSPAFSWAQAATAPLSGEEKALHALNRLAYGPRPADMAAIKQQGAERWLQAFLAAQLEPARLSPPEALKTRLAALNTQTLSQGELIGRYREASQANRVAKREATAMDGKADDAKV